MKTYHDVMKKEAQVEGNTGEQGGRHAAAAYDVLVPNSCRGQERLAEAAAEKEEEEEEEEEVLGDAASMEAAFLVGVEKTKC